MKTRLRLPVAVMAVIAVYVIGCATATESKLFVNSSADVNNGATQRTHIQAYQMSDAVQVINDLMTQRGLVVVEKLVCSDTQCRLVYKSAAPNQAARLVRTEIQTHRDMYPYAYSGMFWHPFYTGPVTTTTHQTVQTERLEYFSKYFISISRTGDGSNGNFSVDMIGVPVINSVMSCPKELLSAFVECQSPVVLGEKDKTLADSLKEKWNFDISGKIESEMIAGIYTELEIIRGTITLEKAAANSDLNSSTAGSGADSDSSSEKQSEMDTDTDVATADSGASLAGDSEQHGIADKSDFAK
ncbi:MAG: hypothetical protein JXR76_24965 [Deltaproteobacteria bacterium]|nr:hypothetical protein [Deltaproteobacteria bacterium]